MSTRWYRMYQKNNPQLRVFLPNFWMKIVDPPVPLPPNIVEFHCSMQMTRYDVKNYLEKIYKVDVKNVRTRIKMGKFRRCVAGGYIIKDDDIKVAYATLPKEQSFVFPNLFKNEEEKKDEEMQKKTTDEMKMNHKKFLHVNNKPGVPGWFGV